MVETIAITIISVIITGIAGGFQFKMRQFESQLDEKVTKDEVKELISDKLAVHHVQLVDIKKDIDKMCEKIDKLLETR